MSTLQRPPLIAFLLNALLTLFLVGSGCSGRKENQRVFDAIGQFRLIEQPGLMFRIHSGGSSSGLGMPIATLDVMGEIVSTNGQPLPDGFITNIVQRFRGKLVKEGCVITSTDTMPTIHFPPSGTTNANTALAKVEYSVNGSKARIRIVLAERNYVSVANQKVVGHLIFEMSEVR